MILAAIALIVVFLATKLQGDKNEKLLYGILMDGYKKSERPVANSSLPLQVTLEINFQQIIDVDEKNQIVQANIWIELSWKDYSMNWTPQAYGGVESLKFPAEQLWKPDIMLFNSAEAAFDSTYASMIVVSYDGNIIWNPPAIVRVSCLIDITWFPFDDQLCHFFFGSWTYPSKKLDLFTPETGFKNDSLMENSEWVLMEKPVKKIIKKRPEFPDDDFVTVDFQFHLRRRTLYYGFNFIGPSLLISLLTILGFVLPVESCEKITLETTVLLSICVYLTTVSNATPPTSESMPLLGVFFSFQMIIVSASVVFNVMVLNLHYRKPDTHEMSDTMKNVLLNWLPWILRVRRPGYKFERPQKTTSKRSFGSVDLPAVARKSRTISSSSSLDVGSRIGKCLKIVADNPANFDASYYGALLTMQQIYFQLKFVTERMKCTDEAEQKKNDWKFAALVVDRLCVYLFSVFFVVGSCGILFSAPYLVA